LAGESTSGAERADAESEITLGLLDAVHENSALSQRSLSKELGIALGLTNAYLRRCIHKGWIKVKRAPANRYAYYLTPKGFSEKSRLTARYLSRSFHFYTQARSQLDEAFEVCAEQGWRRVALSGAGELAEIALLCAMQYPVTVVGVADERWRPGQFMHVDLVRDLDELGRVDAVLLTNLKRPQAAFEALAERLEPERLLAPKLLKVSRRAPEESGG
jgi:DNA-binding MarR family transcriptional regulator